MSESKCRGYIKSESPLSYFVTPRLEGTLGFDIPKSQVSYGRKIPISGKPGQYHYAFTLPNWLIEKKFCHELLEK